MQGTIRFIVGLLVTYGAVGGMDTSDSLLISIGLAIIGLTVMYSGVTAMKETA